MTEKKLVQLLYDYFEANSSGDFIFWRAPAFKTFRWDIFGIFDVVIVFRTGQVHFIQVTTAPNLAARRRKIVAYFEQVKFKIPNAYIFAWSDINEEFIIEEI